MNTEDKEMILKLIGCRVSGGVRRKGVTVPEYWVIDPRFKDLIARHVGHAFSREAAIEAAYFRLIEVKQ